MVCIDFYAIVWLNSLWSIISATVAPVFFGEQRANGLSTSVLESISNKINEKGLEKLDRFTQKGKVESLVKLPSFFKHLIAINWCMKFDTRSSLCGRGLEW